MTEECCSQVDLFEGEIRNIRWDTTGENVSQNLHMIGLNPKMRETLLEYCDNMGITQIMKEVTIGSDDYEHQGEDALDVHTDIRLRGFDWYIQRADGVRWKSDMHWISPSDAIAEENFLEAFGQAGFDQVLESVGVHFGYRHLAAYHLSIIAVSHSDPGEMHVDCTNTGAKAINIIIPLILANDTGPELAVRDGMDKTKAGKYRYQYNVAPMLGDDAYHGTGAVDYSPRCEMRMAATLFVADIDATNIGSILDRFVCYPQAYPPASNPEILLRTAGRHWDPNDPSKKLPTAAALNK